MDAVKNEQKEIVAVPETSKKKRETRQQSATWLWPKTCVFWFKEKMDRFFNGLKARGLDLLKIKIKILKLWINELGRNIG